MDQDEEEEGTIGQAELDILVIQAREGELDAWMELVRYSKEKQHAIRMIKHSPGFQNLVLSIASSTKHHHPKRNDLLIQLLQNLVYSRTPETDRFLFHVCLSCIVHHPMYPPCLNGFSQPAR